MNIIAWIVLGGFAGWVASILMGTNQSMGLAWNVIAGIVGAMVGGLVFNVFGASGVTGFNWYSFIVATVGAVIAIGVVKLVRH